MMHAPIYGSIINAPAKLFKRFTPTESVTVGGNIIEFEKNYYKTFYSFRWVESTDKQEGEYHPLQGLSVPNGYLTIKCNGKWKTSSSALNEPQAGDLISLEDKLWTLEAVQKIRNKSLVNFATVYLTLKKIL